MDHVTFYRSKPKIYNLPLSEIRRYCGLFHDKISDHENQSRADEMIVKIVDNDYKFRDQLNNKYFYLALSYIIDNYPFDSQKHFRLDIIEQIYQNNLDITNIFFICIICDRKRYWILSNQSACLTKTIHRKTEYYCDDYLICRFKNGQWRNILLYQKNANYCRIIFLYLELLFCFMFLDISLLDCDISFLIKCNLFYLFKIDLLVNHSKNDILLIKQY